MYKTLVSLNVLFLFLTFTSHVQAQRANLTYVSQQRIVNYSRSVGSAFGGSTFPSLGIEQRDQSDSVGLFDVSIAGQSYGNSDPNAPLFVPALEVAASQTSNFNFNSITASGSFDGFSEDDLGLSATVMDIGSSFLRVVFDLDGPAAYSIEVSSEDFGNVEFFKLDEANNDFFINSIIPNGNQVSQTGVLDAGRYQLYTGVEPFFSTDFAFPSSGSFEIDLQINAVPEPSAFILLLGAGFGFAVRRHRKTD